jgi:hypothetical protein
MQRKINYQKDGGISRTCPHPKRNIFLGRDMSSTEAGIREIADVSNGIRETRARNANNNKFPVVVSEWEESEREETSVNQ